MLKNDFFYLLCKITYLYLNHKFNVLDRAYRKRRRVSENQEIEDRLESLILRVGEKVSNMLIILN